PPDAGSGPLKGLDRAGMIVRLDLERDSQAIADVDDASVLLPRAHQNFGGLGGKAFQQWARVLIRAMLAPHDRENAQLGIARLASGDFFQRAIRVGLLGAFSLGIDVAPEDLLLRIEPGQSGLIGEIAAFAMRNRNSQELVQRNLSAEGRISRGCFQEYVLAPELKGT